MSEFLFGRPLRSQEEHAQKIGPLHGIPVLGLDALASASYGPEAALTILMVLGGAATHYIGAISAIIIAVLVIVYLSYRQTISAYTNGGGAYTVAAENLGPVPALLAASALFLDYVLNVAVAISAGVGAIVSAAPVLLPYTLPLCLAILAVITVANLRGVREAGFFFLLPTYAFVGCLGGTVLIGVAKATLAHGHPTPVFVSPASHMATTAVTGAAALWVLLRAFASGCTAMTGVEAVSNAVPLFREPTVRNARRTLTAIIAALAFLLAGIAFLVRAYGITATAPGTAGYQSVVSQVVGAVVGRGAFYYVTIVAVVAVLSLSANTSFADFPRLCRVLALDDYLPADFAHPGRRLVYSVGIVVLATLAAILLIVFGGITDHLIPLFAVGAFLTFTMSQAGMVVHWKRVGGPHATRSRILNGAGAVATAATLVVVIVSKFLEGAWITVLIVPALVMLLRAVRAQEDRIDRETDVDGPLQLDQPPPPIVVVPVKRLNRVARKALRLAVSMSPDVQVVQVFAEALQMDDLRRHWRESVERPLQDAGFASPELVLLHSPYREFFGPLLAHVRALTKAHPRRYVAVVVPELVDRRWYHTLLRSQTSTLLKGILLWRGGPQVIVINSPWYLRTNEAEVGASKSA
ncbi:MAG TPA: APC family permease [Gemmatimonadaceae bacterium]|nr:APC family permease [Gemmatimonadaceae bacterium]